jgi:hypothetical protein
MFDQPRIHEEFSAFTKTPRMIPSRLPGRHARALTLEVDIGSSFFQREILKPYMT